VQVPELSTPFSLPIQALGKILRCAQDDIYSPWPATFELPICGAERVKRRRTIEKDFAMAPEAA
jgi:hypothetical protein